MKAFEWLVRRLSMWLQVVAGIALTFVMLLTGSDIVGRAFRAPIPGSFEIVSFVGGLVVGLAVPVTSLAKEHVMVDIVVNALSARVRLVLAVITRLIGSVLFLMMAFSFVRMGMQIKASGEVTSVLNLPFYPVAYAMGGAFLVEALVLIVDMVKTAEAENG